MKPMKPLTELEARLLAPGGKELQLKLNHQLQSMELGLRQRIVKGLSREEFGLATALADSALAAQEVLQSAVG